MHQKILILDFGAQYTQLIARRVRECGVYCEIHPWDVSDELRARVRRGGNDPVRRAMPRPTREVRRMRPARVFELGCRCWASAMACRRWRSSSAARSTAGNVREFGYAEVRARGHSLLLRDIQDRVNSEGHGLLDVWMSHGDKVTALPPGFKIIASNAATPLAAWRMRRASSTAYSSIPRSRIRYREGHSRALRARDLRAGRDWNMPSYIDEAVGRIRSSVGADEVILGLSGGRRLGGGRRLDPPRDRTDSSPVCSSTPGCCGSTRRSR